MLILYPEYQERYRTPSYSITVNTAARRMTLFKDGKVFKTYSIAIGKPSTTTSKVGFRIINKSNILSDPFGTR